MPRPVPVVLALACVVGLAACEPGTLQAPIEGVDGSQPVPRSEPVAPVDSVTPVPFEQSRPRDDY